MAVDASKRARLLVEAERIAHLGSWEWDVRSGAVHWSEELYRIFGFAADEFTPSYDAYLDRVHPDDRARVRATIESALAAGGQFTGEHRIVRKDGEVRILRSRGDVLVDGEGAAEMFGTCYDVTEQRRADQQARQALSLLQATLEAAHDAIAVLDRRGRLAGWNQKFLDLWQLSPADAVLGDVTLFRRHAIGLVADPDGFAARLAEIDAAPECDSDDTVMLLDGRVLERRSHPQRLEGRVVGRVWSFRDITERHRLLESRAAACVEAEGALAERDAFLSIASHELRTPVTSLQLYVQNLLSGVPTPLARDEALHKPLRAIERQARRLKALVGDMLDATRLQGGTLDLYPQAMDLSAAAAAVVARVGEDAARAGVALGLDSDGALVGVWDRVRIEQVIEKLVHNALRWGAGHPVQVRVGRAGERARLEVIDRGPGVAPEEREAIFERYARTDKPRSYGGLGLGLFIARRLVNAHGGRIFQEPAVGGGSRFVVELPLHPPAQGASHGG